MKNCRPIFFHMKNCYSDEVWGIILLMILYGDIYIYIYMLENWAYSPNRYYSTSRHLLPICKQML